MYNCHRHMKRYYLALVGILMLSFAVEPASAQIPLGTTMPGQDVALTNPDGSTTTLGALKGSEGTLVVFWGNRCPWVGKIEDRVKAFAGTFAGSGRAMILVNSNDGDAFPAESVAKVAEAAGSLGSGMVYVSDPNGELMKALSATRMPEFFLFEKDDALIYTGSLDDSPGDPDKVSKTYLVDAFQAMTGGGQVANLGVTKPFGCMIKAKR